jgi:filamentous hemagglutinin
MFAPGDGSPPGHEFVSAGKPLGANQVAHPTSGYIEVPEAPLDATTQFVSDDSTADPERGSIARRPHRILFMGRTPSKYSKTGREVIERMRAEGKIQGEGPLLTGNPNNLKVRGRDKQWYHIDHTVDMAHKVDAVIWWNEVGRLKGKGAPEVRKFMLDSDNYHLEPQKFNRSDGAKLRQVYLPPVPKSFYDTE